METVETKSELLTPEKISAAPDVLPSSRCRIERNRIFMGRGVYMVPIYCINCGVQGPNVIDADWGAVQNFAAYICQDCADKNPEAFGAMITPDELFWSKLHAAQTEEFGRDLTEPELIEALKDNTSVIAQLAKDRSTQEKIIL